jgi:protein-tyrosine kinase
MDKLRAVAEPVRKEAHTNVVVSAAPAVAVNHDALDAQPTQPQPSKSAERFAVDREALRRTRVVFPNDGSEAARAYKMLRTQLLHRVRENGYRVIGITSPADGEGKTLTAINLALSLAAEPNQTVLLVDLDLHRPSVAKTFGAQTARGVEACLAAGADVREVLMRPAGIDRLAVLPASEVGPGSSELLAAERTRALLGELRTRYDDRLILLDLPPVLLTDDVLTLTPLLDAVLLVVAERRTRREDVVRATELISGVPLVGTVLNQAHEVEKRVY